jgi:hypothetical protein
LEIEPHKALSAEWQKAYSGIGLRAHVIITLSWNMLQGQSFITSHAAFFITKGFQKFSSSQASLATVAPVRAR